MLKGHWPAMLSTLLIITIITVRSQKPLSETRRWFSKQLQNGIAGLFCFLFFSFGLVFFFHSLSSSYLPRGSINWSFNYKYHHSCVCFSLEVSALQRGKNTVQHSYVLWCALEKCYRCGVGSSCCSMCISNHPSLSTPSHCFFAFCC